MDIADLLTPDRIAWDLKASSKKRTLEKASELLASGMGAPDAPAVLAKLVERERLGSTGLGAGVAIPHGRCPGIEHSIGAFLRLDHPIEFEAIDGMPVDLVFALIVPAEATDEHLRILAHLATLFHDRGLCAQLRAAEGPGELLELLRAPPRRAAAG